MNQESRLEHNPNNSNLHRKIATYVKVSAIHACLRFAIANLSRQIISQRPRIDLNRRFLHRPNKTTA